MIHVEVLSLAPLFPIFAEAKNISCDDNKLFTILEV
jgi:hypothetical protein